jgi:hypothetical protein
VAAIDENDNAALAAGNGGRSPWRRARRAMTVTAQVALGQLMAWLLRRWLG